LIHFSVYKLLLPVALVSLLLAGCRSEAEVAVALVPATAVASATAVATTLPPPLVSTAVPAPLQQSFTLNAVKTAEPAVTAVATSLPPAEPPAPATTAPGASIASPTAAPTFTPPALTLRQSSGHAWDHYWLGRPVREGGVVWTDKVYPYGSTRGGSLRVHHGVEFNVSQATEILAAAGGTVRVAGNDSLTAFGPTTNFYGNLVVIEHDFQFNGRAVFTLYAHLSHLFVTAGQVVKAQDVIALSGASGVADGPHLHFEVRLGENSYDTTRNPLLWLYPFPERGVVAGRVTWPDGSPVREAPISLRRIDASSAYAATTTYGGPSANGDDNWLENFVLDDVYAGYYELTVHNGEKKYKVEFWVYPYQTSFVTVVLE
jgi:murein DD-endopeptidase MepM/ murein hydrolase activator NlpD